MIQWLVFHELRDEESMEWSTPASGDNGWNKILYVCACASVSQSTELSVPG